jgi:hypothetical protein
MVHVLAKCEAFYLNRMHQQLTKQDNLTAQWIMQHKRLMQTACPPDWVDLSMETEYLRAYLQDGVYMPEIRQHMGNRQRLRCIYTAQFHKYCAGHAKLLPRVQAKRPQLKWERVWANINNKVLPRRVQITWYTILHDIIPTSQRLHAIHLQDSDTCDVCQQTDTLIRRYTTCSKTSAIWEWTRQRIAVFLRVNERHVPDDWITVPSFQIYPPQRHNATTWMLGNMIQYVHDNSLLNMEDYIDFLRRARWKERTHRVGLNTCGNYLDVIDY